MSRKNKQSAEETVTAQPQQTGPRIAKARFSGPADPPVPLRVMIDRTAYAEVTAHAKESLSAEICGVLAGHVCQDDKGLFLHVKAAVRGTAAREGSTHVTFTQETWTAIHEQMERQYSSYDILGWYHSHPGFGVEFSEMDLFIQRNFFRPNTQIAFVTDPLGGDVAICVITDTGVQQIDRFWVDGREHRCKATAAAATGAAGPAAADAGGNADLRRTLADMETRLSQVIQAADEQRQSMHRLALTCGMVICTAIVLGIAYMIYNSMVSSVTPPQLHGYVDVPVVVGDRVVKLGVAVVRWEVPPDLNAAYVQVERERREAEARAAAAATQATTRPAAQ